MFVYLLIKSCVFLWLVCHLGGNQTLFFTLLQPWLWLPEASLCSCSLFSLFKAHLKVCVPDPAEKGKATCPIGMKESCKVPFQKGGRKRLAFLTSSLNVPALMFVWSCSPGGSCCLGSGDRAAHMPWAYRQPGVLGTPEEWSQFLLYSSLLTWREGISWWGGEKKKKEECKDLPAAWLTNKAKNNKNK